ncbi:MAG: oxidoreductase [bacterium]|nr:oxidoreductase [bacterium]
MTERRLAIDIWSDIVCPWCFVGKRRLEAALARFDHRDAVDVRWRSFELDPSAPRSYEGQGSYAERLSRKYGTDVAEAQRMIDRMTKTGAAEGAVLDFTRARGGNTFDAHRLLHFAAALGRQDALEERLFRACFSEGEPIADRDVLVRLAADVGLDAEQARGVLDGDAYEADVRADQAQAAELGIRGVPFFVLDGRYGVSGAQPADALLQMLERVWSDVESDATGSGEAIGVDGRDGR